MLNFIDYLKQQSSYAPYSHEFLLNLTKLFQLSNVRELTEDNESLSERACKGQLNDYVTSNTLLFDSTPSETMTPEEASGLHPYPDEHLRRTNPKRYDAREDWYESNNEHGDDSPVSNRYDNAIPISVGASLKFSWDTTTDFHVGDKVAFAHAAGDLEGLLYTAVGKITSLDTKLGIATVSGYYVNSSNKLIRLYDIQLPTAKVYLLTPSAGVKSSFNVPASILRQRVEELDWEIEKQAEAENTNVRFGSTSVVSFLQQLQIRYSTNEELSKKKYSDLVGEMIIFRNRDVNSNEEVSKGHVLGVDGGNLVVRKLADQNIGISTVVPSAIMFIDQYVSPRDVIAIDYSSKAASIKFAAESFDHYKSRNNEMFRRRFRGRGQSGGNIFWSSDRAQSERFNALLKIGDLQDKTILDVGCGYGDLYQFLLDKGIRVASYTGYDIVPEILEIAKQKHPEVVFKQIDITKDGVDEKFDYVFGSGIFAIESDNWTAYMLEMVEKMFDLCNNGVGVNYLSNKTALKSNELHYSSPEETILDIKKKIIGHSISALDDYLFDDYTIFIYRKEKG